MRALARVGVVVAGYVVAAVAATVAVAVHTAHTANDSRGADGMYAFGDLLLFVLVFALVALVPTGIGIYFLVSRRFHRENTGSPGSTGPL